MGWGIEFNADIYLSRQVFNSKTEVEEKIEEIVQYINNSKSMLMMFASSTPKDIIPEEWEENPLDWINNQINEILDTLQEDMIKTYNLRLYLEYLEENPIKKDDK